jgi:hypothetical protein
MRALLLTSALAALAAAASPAFAQDAAPAAERDTTPAAAALGEGTPAPGWTFTPSASVSRTWDSNPLMQNNASSPEGDFVSVLNPRAELSYIGARSTVTAGYNGAFELYRQFDSLNNYGQNESVHARRRTSARTTWFAQQELSVTPTTEQQLLIGVPFERVGATIADFKGGVDHAFSKRTTAELTYDFQLIKFDQDPVVGKTLIGGHGHNIAGTWKHQFTAHTSIMADYGLAHASIIDGTTFTVQTALAGAEYHFSPSFSVFAEGGASHVTQTAFETSQTSPSWRAGANRAFHRFSLDAAYSRSFMPAFGVGNALESRDVGVHGRIELTRNLYAEGAVDRRVDSPIANTPNPLGEAPIHSTWFNSLVGYTASRWLHIEGFFTATHQDVARPGGLLDRNRIGVQVVTTKPMRVH